MTKTFCDCCEKEISGFSSEFEISIKQKLYSKSGNKGIDGGFLLCEPCTRKIYGLVDSIKKEGAK